MKNNFVAKHINKFNRPAVHKNSIREMKLGNEKHPIDYTLEYEEMKEDVMPDSDSAELE